MKKVFTGTVVKVNQEKNNEGYRKMLTEKWEPSDGNKSVSLHLGNVRPRESMLTLKVR